MTRLTRTPFLRAVALFGALLLPSLPWAAPARAQTADATVEIDVVDETGVALPGRLGRAQARRDRLRPHVRDLDRQGAVRFPAVPPAAGYIAAGRPPGLRAGRAGADAPDRPDGQGQGRPPREGDRRVGHRRSAKRPSSTSTRSTRRRTSSRSRSRTLPVANREFEKLAFIAPGVQRERGEFRFVTGGPVIGSGGNASQSTILVDGVDYTDPALGLAKTRVSQDAIAEFRVVNSRFDAEVGGSAGGALTVLTKTGTNELKGSPLRVLPRTTPCAPRAPSSRIPSVDFRRGQYGVTLGGPIVEGQDPLLPLGRVRRRGDGPRSSGPRAPSCRRPPTSRSRPTRSSPSARSRTASPTRSRSSSRPTTSGTARRTSASAASRTSPTARSSSATTTTSPRATPAVVGASTTNELRAQFGSRKYFEPTNSDAVADWFSIGNTLKTGGNILGDLLGEGDQFEIRDTLYFHLTGKSGTHDVKVGAGWQHVKDRSIIDTYADGALPLGHRHKTFPIAYGYGVGSSDVTVTTDRIAAFVQDDWRPMSNLTVSLGLRYDLDTNGNNPGFTHPLVPERAARGTRTTSSRASASPGTSRTTAQFVARGGWGLFTGRYLLVPSFTELQQNGETGRKLYTRVNGLLYGLPAFALDPNNPTTTGIPLPIDITLLDQTLDAPEASQFSVGLTSRLGRPGLYLDVEGVYVEGRQGDHRPRRELERERDPRRARTSPTTRSTPTPTTAHSEYKALTVRAQRERSRAATSSRARSPSPSKNNLNDDFSPEFPTGYPSDPADIEAEYGRARSAERMRVRPLRRLPPPVDVHRRADLRVRLRPAVDPPLRLRLQRRRQGERPDARRRALRRGRPRLPQLRPAAHQGASTSARPANLELIVEGFNLFNTTNYDVASIDGAEYLSGPTIANPAAVAVNEPELRQAERDAAVPRDPARRAVRLLGSSFPRHRPAGGIPARRTLAPLGAGPPTAAHGPAEGETPS